MATAPFVIIGKLGAGGMADVFLARMQLDGRTEEVALKRIRETMTDRPEVWAQFQREAAINGLLNHPGIVRVRGVGTDAEGPWLALQYVAGATAQQLIASCNRNREAFPLEEALIIARDAAEGLAHAHGFTHDSGVGVVHRDVSPDNLLVGYDGRTRVSDFGIARLEGHTRFTRTGEVRGKMGFLAPELIEGGEPGTASDVFAFGATLFKLLTGVAPFRGNNDGELFRNLLMSEAPDLSALRPDLPAPIAKWVQQALSKQADARPSMSALVPLIGVPDEGARGKLGAWVKHLRPPTTQVALPAERAAATPSMPVSSVPQTTVQAPAMHDGRRRTPLWVGGALIVIAIAGGVAWQQGPAEVDAPAPPPPRQPLQVEPVVVADPPPEPVPPEPLDAGLAVAPPVDAGAPIEPVETDAPVKQPARAKRGSVDIRVTPFADVFIDGRLIGTTPIKPQELTPGQHKVLLVNGDKKTTKVVTIEAGKRAKLIVDLSR